MNAVARCELADDLRCAGCLLIEFIQLRPR